MFTTLGDIVSQLKPGQVYEFVETLPTPAGRFNFLKESIVLAVGSNISISRLCVDKSNCSRDFLSITGERKTV